MPSAQMARKDSAQPVFLVQRFLDSVRTDMQRWHDDLARLDAQCGASLLTGTMDPKASWGKQTLAEEQKTLAETLRKLSETPGSRELQIPQIACPLPQIPHAACPQEESVPALGVLSSDSISLGGDKSDNASNGASPNAASDDNTTSPSSPKPPAMSAARSLPRNDLKRLPTWLCETAGAGRPRRFDSRRTRSPAEAEAIKLPEWDKGCWLWFRMAVKYVVRGKWFDFLIGAAILMNIALIGWEQSVVISGGGTQGFKVAEHVFLIVYILEISLRIVSEGKPIFKSHFFLFDMVLVAIGVICSWIIGPVVSLTQSDVQGVLDKLFILRTLRLLRLVRALRLLVQFKTIWRLVNGLLNSVDILMSTCMLLILTLYCFASVGLEIFALNGALRADPVADEIITKYMSSLPVMMLTLVRFVTLDDLAEVFTPLLMEQPTLTIFYVCAILIVSVTLMNLVTALLVEKAIQNAKVDVETKRFHRQARLRSLTPQIRKLFRQLDKDGSGQVTKQEVFEALQKYEGELSIPPTLSEIFFSDSVMELFDLLDADYSGQIDEDEFVGGVIQMAMTDIPLETRQILKIQRYNTKKIEHVEIMMIEYLRHEFRQQRLSRGTCAKMQLDES